MSGTLYLLDGMALIYRAHFALIRSPIFNSKGFNTSGLVGFTNTLLDIRTKHSPTHLAVAFDTSAPTPRHTLFPDYKAQREEMPEDLSKSLPILFDLLAAMNVPVLRIDGFEADDIIGTLARRAETEGFTTYMVTPDKDFGQLVTDKILIYKPGRQGSDTEILGVPEVCARWGIERPTQVIDILGLMGDASDNIPGVPGIGEKTAAKLISQFGSIEEVIARSAELKGKQKELIETHKDQALLSKNLATIICDVPVDNTLTSMAVQEPDRAALSKLFVELEFNSLGRRILGDDFKAGRGSGGTAAVSVKAGELALGDATEEEAPVEAASDDLFSAALKTIKDVPHDYTLISDAAGIPALLKELTAAGKFCFDLETTSLDPSTTEIVGIAFSTKPFTGSFLSFPSDKAAAAKILEQLLPVLQNEKLIKIGHNLKFDLSVLKWQGVDVAGPFFDTMLAHALVEPDAKHTMDHLSERYLGYTPISIRQLIGAEGGEQLNMREVPIEQVAEYAAEDADVTFQLEAILAPLLKQQHQERVFFEIEAPLLPVLIRMEREGVALDLAALADFSKQLEKELQVLEMRVLTLAGTTFNLNSPKQLGHVLFDQLKLVEKPKKTKTGQYVTNEQVLETLASQHEIVAKILEYREAAKLKNTYVDALPAAINPRSGRVHTTYHQLMTATGRLASQNPNLQNIPIRTALGRQIRKAFVPGTPDRLILSADYSQIELRVMAHISGDPAMQEAFRDEKDIHSATSARVYGVAEKDVTADMRRTAKMVNFGIIYGISAFGLSQRLAIPREEAARIIDEYFKQYPGVRKFMDDVVANARTKGYVETLTGRRRTLRDITSQNATIRNAAERTAINTPIQGTAADMIKIAMTRIDQKLREENLRTRMLLQVHDELVFETDAAELEQARALVAECMKNALPLNVPVLVETGSGANWLEAH